MKTKMITAVIMSYILSACATDPTNDTKSLSSSKGNIYTFESDANGFNTQTHFYDNGEEVVAFDTQFTPELAKKALEFIKSKTKNPVTHVVITHPNPDKFNGMKVFQDQGAKILSSSATSEALPGVHQYKKYFFVNMAKMFTEESYPKLSSVDVRFSGTFNLVLQNGEKIELSELSQPGVSSTQTVAYIPKVNALIVGDLIHHKAHAWLEGGIVEGKATPTLEGWIADLNELETKYSSANPIVYGGRGLSAKLSEVSKAQIDYLLNAKRLVSSHIREINDDSLFTGDAAAKQYSELTEKFAKVYPDYQLTYMIQFGIYGLVQQTL
jgi:glyoxylase-like metal-dependent hydrolase (beta-lactamase superfamily II)